MSLAVSSVQRPSPCWLESFKQLTRGPRRTSMLQKTASLQLERSWGLGQSVLTSARSFPTGSAGSHSTRTKKRLSTHLTSCVTSLKGTSALFAPLFIEAEMPLYKIGDDQTALSFPPTATTPLSSDQTTPTCPKFSSSSQMELQTNRLRVKMPAAKGWQMSSVKYRWAITVTVPWDYI